MLIVVTIIEALLVNVMVSMQMVGENVDLLLVSLWRMVQPYE